MGEVSQNQTYLPSRKICEINLRPKVFRIKMRSELGAPTLISFEVGDELQLKISKAGNASRFEKNSPPEVLRVIEGANHH